MLLNGCNSNCLITPLQRPKFSPCPLLSACTNGSLAAISRFYLRCSLELAIIASEAVIVGKVHRNSGNEYRGLGLGSGWGIVEDAADRWTA